MSSGSVSGSSPDSAKSGDIGFAQQECNGRDGDVNLNAGNECIPRN
jgi:hypothetical protein